MPNKNGFTSKAARGFSPQEEPRPGLRLELCPRLLPNLDRIRLREGGDAARLHDLLAINSGDQAPEVQLAVRALVCVP